MARQRAEAQSLEHTGRASELEAEVQTRRAEVVELRIKRGDKELDFSYQPAGPPQRGQGFIRVPNIPDRQCL